MSDVHVAAFMPVLNEGERIERAIDSLQRQTHPVSKLVVVDGGSTDATREVVERAAETVDFPIDLHVLSGAGVRESSQFGAEAAVAFLLDEHAAGDGVPHDADARTADASDVPSADSPASAADGGQDVGSVAADRDVSGVEARQDVDDADASQDVDAADPSQNVDAADDSPAGDAVADAAADDGVVLRLEGDSALEETFVETAVAHLSSARFSAFGAPVRPHDPSTRRVLKRCFTLAQNAEGLPKGRGMAFRARDFREVDGYRIRPGEELSASSIDCLEDGILVAKLLERGDAAFARDTCVYSSVPSTTATSPRRWRTALRIEREMGPTRYFTRIANPLNTALYAGQWLAGACRAALTGRS